MGSDGDRLRLQIKNLYDWSRKYPLIAEALYRLRATAMVLDGEAMCFTNGMHDFDKLWSNCFDDTVQLCTFDLLELNGDDYRVKPLAERKKRLGRLLARPRDGIEYVEQLEWRAHLRTRPQAWIARDRVEAS